MEGRGDSTVIWIWVRFGSVLNTLTAFSPIHQPGWRRRGRLYSAFAGVTPLWGSKRSGQNRFHLFVPVILSKMGVDPSGLSKVILVDHNFCSLK